MEKPNKTGSGGTKGFDQSMGDVAEISQLEVTSTRRGPAKKYSNDEERLQARREQNRNASKKHNDLHSQNPAWRKIRNAQKSAATKRKKAKKDAKKEEQAEENNTNHAISSIKGIGRDFVELGLGLGREIVKLGNPRGRRRRKGVMNSIDENSSVQRSMSSSEPSSSNEGIIGSSIDSKNNEDISMVESELTFDGDHDGSIVLTPSMEIVKIKSTTKDDDMSMDTSMGENSLTSYSTTLTNITIASIAATKDSDDSMYMIDGKLRIRGHAVRQMSNRCIGSTELKNIMEKGTKGKENDKETFVLNNIKVYYDPKKDVIDTIYFIDGTNDDGRKPHNGIDDIVIPRVDVPTFRLGQHLSIKIEKQLTKARQKLRNLLKRLRKSKSENDRLQSENDQLHRTIEKMHWDYSESQDDTIAIHGVLEQYRAMHQQSQALYQQSQDENHFLRAEIQRLRSAQWGEPNQRASSNAHANQNTTPSSKRRRTDEYNHHDRGDYNYYRNRYR